MNLNRLKSNIEELEKLLSDYELQLKEDENNFSLKLQVNSLNNQINDLREQLYFENLKREKEILELRLIGDKTKYGNIPLNFVGGITNNFSNFLYNTSKYLKFGNKGGKRREAIIQETIDLRFEGLGKGSTIFYLSAKTSPDLFGNSITQQTLENSFKLLSSENSDEISDNISGVGGKSIKYLSKFLNELVKSNIEIDIKWESPFDKIYKWEGKKDKLTSLFNTLNQITISEPEEIDFEGELITISLKGKFEILTSERIRYFGQFSNDLLDKMKEFHIGDHCKGIIIKTTIYNPLSDKEKVEYNLKSIN